MKTAPIPDEEVEKKYARMTDEELNILYLINAPIKNKDIHKNETEAYSALFHDDATDFFLKNFKGKDIILVQKLIRLYNHYNNEVFNNLEYINGIDDKVQETGFSLTSTPKTPRPYKIDKILAEKYIALFAEKKLQETARKIIFDGYITHISFGDFEKSLYWATLKFQQHLLINKINPNSLSVFIEKDHSSQWVASLALPYLNFFPNNCKFIIDDKFNVKIENGTHNFVLFDDWSITGNQLSRYLEGLKDDIKIAQNKSKDPLNVKLNVICVIPLMTPDAFKLLNEYKLHDNISLTIITDKFIPTLKSIKQDLSPTDAKNLSEILKESFGKDSRVLCFSDWKKPDYLSMPMAFSEGIVPLDLTPYKQTDHNPPNANQVKFIPAVKPPYHK